MKVDLRLPLFFNMTMFNKPKKGQALVEFAIVIVLLLMIVLGLIDWGLYLYSVIILDSAVRDAVRIAVTRNDWAVNYEDRVEEVKDVILDRASFLPVASQAGLRGRVYVSHEPNVNNAETITVEVRNQPYTSISGFLGIILPDNISTRAKMHYERR